MFNDLFTEYAKEVIKAGNELNRPTLAAGYNKHAEAKVIELLKSLLKAAKSDNCKYLIELLESRIKELEDAGRTT